MPRVLGGDFSVDIDERFTSVQLGPDLVSARAEPRTLTSPAMSIWATKAKRGQTVAKLLSGTVDGELVERRVVIYAGFEGEYIRQRDRLVDRDSGVDTAWYRIRVVLAAPDRKSFRHATAMCAEADLVAVEGAFEAMLASVRLGSEAPPDTMEAETKPATAFVGTAAAPPDDTRNDDPWARVDRALAEAGFSARREAIEPLMAAALIFLEAGAAKARGPSGVTRIGGGPDLPHGIDWPRDASGLHLTFLAQIDLADLPSREAVLPMAGLLSFFIGSEFADGRIFYSAPDQVLVVHTLPRDAAEIASVAASMLDWDADLGRMVLVRPGADGLEAETEADGRVRFRRNGEPVIALASEYDFSATPQALRVLPSLTLLAPNAAAYAAAGLDDPFPLWEAVSEGLDKGAGPQHQMFGHAGSWADGDASPPSRAVCHARERGWSDLTEHSDWFVLLALRSGGKAGFDFADHDTILYMANRLDTANADFSRIFAFIDQG